MRNSHVCRSALNPRMPPRNKTPSVGNANAKGTKGPGEEKGEGAADSLSSYRLIRSLDKKVRQTVWSRTMNQETLSRSSEVILQCTHTHATHTDTRHTHTTHTHTCTHARVPCKSTSVCKGHLTTKPLLRPNG